jgi:gentisate 1,2-dioxygenase
VHTREAEAWYLLEGTLTYQAADERVDLEPGGFIYLPQGLPHGFRTTGAEPVRYLALTLPGGVMGLYDEVGTPATERRLPDGGVNGDDVARWLAAAPRYGLQIVGGPIGS